MPWLDGHVAVFDPDGSTVDTVAAYDMAPKMTPPRNAWSPFGAVAGVGEGFVQTRSDLAELVWRDAEGNVRQVVRWEPERIYPTEGDWERFRTGMAVVLERLNPGMDEASLSDFLERQVAEYEVDFDQPMPLFGRIYGSETGDVWLERFTPTLRQVVRRYWRVSGDGTRIRLVEFPEPVRILDVGGDLVLGVVEDGLDVQALALFRVESGGG